MEAIILGNPYSIDLGSTTPIVVPAYSSEEAVIILSNGYNPYIIGGGGSGSSNSYWFRYNTGILVPLTISDKVVIGGTSILNSEIFRVVGKVNFNSLQLGTSTTISSVLDEDNMVSNSNTAIPTQQSVKAYVDNSIASSGIHIGDNISLLTNNVGYIITETDPIFIASPSYNITTLEISNWNIAYGWGNHALAGYITTETDPIFTASSAFSITSTNISNWNTAYTDSHIHNNFGLLQTLIGSGSGTNALFDDGTYKSVITSIAGTNNEIQYNIFGSLSASTNLTFDPNTSTFSTVNVIGSGYVATGNSSTYISKNVGGDLVFTDANTGSVTLATIVGGATNYWTTTTGGIYYTGKVGINNASMLTESLTVTGNIEADYFNSSYLRYKSSNLLLGPNAGDLETGSNLLYISNTNTTTPLIYGDFLGQSLTFNADVYINQIKRLSFGNSDVYLRRDSSNNLVFRDLNANSGAEVTLTALTTLTGYALKSDFISYTSVTSITAANLTTWNKASVIVTGGSSTSFLAADGVYHTVSSGGVTPTDNILKWDIGSSYYRIYTDKTEAGGVSSGGKFYGGTTDPTNTNRLNYDGVLHAASFYSNNLSTIGVYGSGTIFGVQGYSYSGNGINTSSQTGVSALFNNLLGNTSDISKFQLNGVDQCIINSSGINLITGATYKINGTPLSYSDVGAEPALGNPSSNGYILSSTTSGTRSWISQLTPVDGILHWDGTAYNPYSSITSASLLVANTSTVSTYNITGSFFNINGQLIAGSTNTSYSGTSISGQTYSGIGVLGSATTSSGVQARSTSGHGLEAYSTTGTSALFSPLGSSSNSSPIIIISKSYPTGSNNYTGDYISIIENSATSGTISGSVLKATIFSTIKLDLNPDVDVTGSGTAYLFDTTNSLGISNWHTQFKNNSTIIAGISPGGGIYGTALTIESSVPSSTTRNELNGHYFRTWISSTLRNVLAPDTPDSSSAVAYLFDTSNSFVTAGAKLLSVQNNGTEKNSIDKDGYIYIGNASVDGCWRFAINSNNLNFERRESGSWVMKGQILA